MRSKAESRVLGFWICTVVTLPLLRDFANSAYGTARLPQEIMRSGQGGSIESLSSLRAISGAGHQPGGSQIQGGLG